MRAWPAMSDKDREEHLALVTSMRPGGAVRAVHFTHAEVEATNTEVIDAVGGLGFEATPGSTKHFTASVAHVRRLTGVAVGGSDDVGGLGFDEAPSSTMPPTTNATHVLHPTGRV
jgi:hypothetical protein